MGLMRELESRGPLQVRHETGTCWIRLDRPDAGNTINRTLIDGMSSVLERCRHDASIVILEGSTEVFSLGADFTAMRRNRELSAPDTPRDSELLYELWRQLAFGPYISVAHVKGRVNAGGVGFVAACDLVISDEGATFGLSELLFGLLPACVMPFLIRRVGTARANQLALTTQPITARQAHDWGLVDLCGERTDELLRRQLLRLRRLEKPAISRYKRYVTELGALIEDARPHAVRAHLEAFSDPRNLSNISRYVTTGRFPWE